MSGLFRNDPATREGKYPVLLRRDGTVPEWEWFVLGARDPQAPDAIRAYADRCERFCLDPQYVADLRLMATGWDEAQRSEATLRAQGVAMGKRADPDGPRHRQDDPDVLAFPGTLAEYRNRLQAQAMGQVVAVLIDRIVAEAKALPTAQGVMVVDTVSRVLEGIAAEFPTETPATPRTGRSA